MSKLKTVFGVFLLSAFLVVSCVIPNNINTEDTTQLQIVQAMVPEETQAPIEPTPTVKTTSEMEIKQVTATPTPIVINPVNGYVFNGLVDLSSEKPTSLSIHLADGSLLSSNWAGAKSFKAEDNQEIVFLPSNGIIYSYLGDVTTSWTHSGINIYGQRFFATDMDIFIRQSTENGRVLSLPEAQIKAESLKGMKAYLCQTEIGEAKLLSSYNAADGCPGKQIEMEVAAVAIIPHESIDEYDEAILNINSWLVENFPGAGFEDLNQGNGWLIRFCIGKLSDQVSDGSHWYTYNRGIIGFRIVDNGEQ